MLYLYYFIIAIPLYSFLNHQYYYKNYYSEEYGNSDEFIFRQAIIDHFKANNVPLLLLTVDKESKYNYDLKLNTSDIPLGSTLHPTEEGHSILADRIYEKILKLRYLCLVKFILVILI